MPAGQLRIAEADSTISVKGRIEQADQPARDQQKNTQSVGRGTVSDDFLLELRLEVSLSSAQHLLKYFAQLRLSVYT
jgi:hypothetical protein